MNKNRYRIIFNKARGMLMAVAETTNSQGKSASGEGQAASSNTDAQAENTAVDKANRVHYKALNPLVYALMVSFGAVSVSVSMDVLATGTTITADHSAPGNQQATILATASGIQQVNIQTPSAAGVSRNTYSQFDVGTEGVILNNSRTNTSTQLAGWIQGNPWLAKGQANVILNEVNSSNPSYLKGYLEVAGGQAQVVVANPSGLVCDGCGVINASRFTLTTGQAVLNNGSLDSFVVRQGNIAFEGKGMDATATSFTDIISRAMTVNAGVYANQLNVALGQNTVKNAVDGTPLNTTANTPDSSVAPVNFALDAGQLGGMYAGKIFLVGTENGVGVRNAGTINATQGPLQLDINGNLTNSGNVVSNNDVLNVNSQSLTNSGNMSSGQAAVHLNQNQLSNSGLISSADELVIRNQGILNNNGGTLNAARVDISADSLTNQSGKIQQTASEGLNLQAGSLSNNQGQLGNIPAASTTTGGSTSTSGSTSTGGTTGTTSGSTTTSGTGSTTTSAQGGQVVSSSPTTVKTYSDGVISTTGQLNNDSGVITANGGINLNSTQGLTNNGGQMALGVLNLSGDQLSNQAGQLYIQSANINTTNLNNQSGYLSVDQQFNIHSQQVNNQLGTILGNQQLNLIADQAIDNTQGKIVALGQLQLQTPTLINSQGAVVSQQNALSLAVANAINNTSGTLQAGTSLTSSSTLLNNQLGQILAQDIVINASQSLNNQQGLIHSGNSLSINSALIDNGIASATTTAAASAGQINADGNLSLSSAQLNNSGLIYSKQNTTVQSGQITQQGGTLAAVQNTSVTASTINADHQSRLAAGLQADGSLAGSANLTVQADHVTLNGQQLASGDLAITGNQTVNLDQSSNQASNINVQSGGSISHQGASSIASNQLTLTTPTTTATGGVAASSIDNTSGLLSANTVSLTANQLTNSQGSIINSGTQDLTLDMQNGINNQAGNIHTNSQNLTLSSAATIDNSAGSIIHAGTGGLNITANQLLGTAGQIDSNGQLNVKTAGQTVFDQAATTAAQISLSADSLTNVAGQLVQTGTAAPLSLSVTNALNNSKGVISSQAAVNTTAASLNNQAGQIITNAGSDINLSVAGTLDNSQAGQIMSGTAAQGNTSIQAGSINNSTGTINAQGTATLKSTLGINNTAGHIAANNDVSLTSQGLNNNQGSIGSVNGKVTIDAGSGSFTNQTGQVQTATDLTVKAGSIDNSVQGLMSAQGTATLTTAQAINNNTGSIIANGDVNTTSQGLTNNQGQIASVKGALNVNAGAGVLSNQSGKLQAGTNISLTASGIDNTSGFIDAQGTVQLLSNQWLINKGGQIIAGSGPINLSAASLNNQGGTLQTNTGYDLNLTIIGLLDNSQYGKILSGANTAIQTGSLDNSTGGQISAQSTATVKADQGINNTAGSVVANGDVTITNNGTNSSSINNNQGTIGSANGLLSVNAGQGALTNQAGHLQAATTLTLTANGIDSTSGFINALGNIQLTSNQNLINQAGQIETTTGIINATAASLNNQGGIIQTNPSYDIVLGISGLLDNSQKGQINSGNTIQLTASQLNNTAGQINAQSTAILKTTQDINNTTGSIVANSDVTLTSNGLNNDQGQISSAKGNLNVDAGSAALTNQTGQLQAAGNVALKAASIDNSVNGQVNAQGAAALYSTGAINNNTGTIAANNDVTINSQGLTNNAGQIGSVSGQLAINTGSGALTSQSGKLQAGKNVSLTAAGIDNTSGQISAQGTATLATTQAVINQSGVIVANGDVYVTAQGVNNNAGQIGSSAGLVNINAGHAALTNQAGHIQAATTINLTADSIDSTSGFIDAQGNIQLTSNQALVNQGGQIVSAAGTVNASAASLNNQGGVIQTNPANDLNLTIIGLLDNSAQGKILSGGNMLLKAGQVNNSTGQMSAQGAATLQTSQDINNTAGSIISNGDVNITSQGLNNNQGTIGSAQGLLDLNAGNGALTNQSGKLQAATTVSLNANNIDSTSGFINAQGNIQLVSQQALINQNGLIETAAGTINATAASLNNQGGVIQTNPANDITLTISGLLDNSQNGQINSGNNVQLQAGQVTNTTGGRITAQNAVNLTASQGVDNTAGTISANNTVGISSQGMVNNGNQGQITAGQTGNLQSNQLSNAGLIYATGVIANTTNDLVNIGTIGAANQITLSGSTINSSGSLLAGLNPDGSFNSTGNLTATAQNALTATGKNIAGSTLQFTGTTVDVSSSTTQATNVNLNATQGGLTLDNAQVSADQLSLQTPTTLSSQGAVVKTNTINLAAHDWNNTSSSTSISSSQNLTVSLAGDLTNSSGLIETNAGQLQLNANNIINQSGSIVSLGQQLGLSSNSLQSTGGQILSAGSINANITGQTTLDGGVLQGHGLNLSTANLSNQSGQIIDLAAAQSSAINVSQTLNNNGGLIYSQNALSMNAGSLTNQSGQIVSAVNPLTLAIQGVLDNTAGLIKSGNSLSLSSAGLINNSGRISSLQPMVVNINGATQNLSGLINSQGTLQFNGQSIDNTGGEISSAGQLDLNTNGQQLTNDNGVIGNASGPLSLTTGALSNNAGLIQTAGDLSIDTNHQLLSNTITNVSGKGIIALGNTTINASSLDNSSGVIQTGGNLSANLDSDLINKSGSITAANANLTAQNSIQNQLGLITADNISLQTGSLINDGDNGATVQGSVINANQTLSINAGSISNQNTKSTGTAQGIQANTIDIVTNALNNTAGSIRANTLADISTPGTITNNNGLISSNNTINIHDDQATRTATISNTAGTIVADIALNVKVQGLSTDGQLTSNGDMTVDLQSDYINQSPTQLNAGGNLNMITTGAVTNQSDLVAGAALTVNALSLDNQYGAKLAGGTATNVSTSGDITNRGLINGGDTTLMANNINNIGTGKIYGDHIAIQANTLNNSPENGVASVIASRGDMDIGVTTLNNWENVASPNSQELIYSGGSLRIGQTLDANKQATGIATTINNRSAQIQSSGNMDINATTVNNLNVLYQTGQTSTSLANGGLTGRIVRVDDHPGELYSEGAGQLSFFSKGRVHIFADVNADYSTFWELSFNQTTTTDYLISSTPAQLIAGGDINFNQSTVNNTGSQILAGGAITGGTVNNNAIQGQKVVSVNGTQAQHYVSGGSGHFNSPVPYTEPDNISSVDLLLGTKTPYQAGTSPALSTDPNNISVNGSGAAALAGASGTAQGNTGLSTGTAGGNANSSQLGSLGANSNAAQTGSAVSTQVATATVANTVITTVGSNTGLQSAVTPTNSTSVSQGTTVSTNAVSKVAALNIAGSTGSGSMGVSPVVTSTRLTSTSTILHIAASTATNVVGSAVTGSVNGQTGTNAKYEIRTLDNQIKVPNVGLYVSEPNSQAGYLIATDPEFTQYQSWLSSDYMLKALNIDGSTTQKRLGDGFYEQRLVQDQVQQLTGRRFLADYTSDDQQYKSLMDNGITYAKAWGLRPGIALTAEQAAQLTSDIIWLVSKTITLQNGTTTTALVPQVYTRVKVGDLMGDGTLISGDQVAFKTKQAINNTGTIAGRQLVSLQAGDINNSGNIRGSTIGLVADRDINNIGGKIEAQDAMMIDAGRNLNIESTTYQQQKKNYGSNGITTTTQTGISRIAGLYVTGGDKVDPNNLTMQINVGGNTTLKAAQISNANGATVINTAGNVDIQSIEVGKKEQLGSTRRSAFGSSRALGPVVSSDTQDIGSNIRGAGDVSINANTIHGTAVNISSQKGNVELLAQHGIQLDAGHIISKNINGTNSSSTIGNQLSAGNSVIIASKAGDINTTQLNANAGKSMLISAEQGSVNLQAGLKTTQATNGRTVSTSETQANNLKAGDNLIITSASGDINATQLEASAGKRIQIAADHGNVNLNAGMSTASSKENNADKNSSSTKTLANKLNAGQDILVSTQSGNINATQLEASAGQSIQLQASQGSVTLNAGLSQTNEHSSSKSKKKSQSHDASTSTSLANSLTAGKDIVIDSTAGDITATNLKATAGGDIQVQAVGGKVALLSDINEQTSSDSSSKKGTFKKSSNASGTDHQQVAQTAIHAGGTVDINASKTIELQANDVQAGKSIYVGNTAMQRQADGSLKAADGSLMPTNVAITTAQTQNKDWSQSKKGFGGLLGGIIKVAAAVTGKGNFTVGKSSSQRHEQTNQTGSTLTANDSIAVGSSGQTTLTSATLNARDTILSGQKVTLNDAVETDLLEQSHGKDSVKGLGVKLNKDNLRLGGVEENKTKQTTTTTSTTHKAGEINTNNLTIQGTEGVDVLGQNITATGDTVIDHGTGRLNIGGYANSTITTDKTHTDTIHAEVGVRNAYVDAAQAAVAEVNAVKALAQATSDYKQAQSDYAAGKITQEALNEAKANIAMATANVASAQIATGSAAASAASSPFAGFSLNGSATHSQTDSSSTSTNTTWQGSNLSLNNLTLKSQGQDANIQGSRLTATGVTTFDGTKDLNVTSGIETGSQRSSSSTNSQTVGASYNGASVGVNASLSKQNSTSNSDSLHHVNSQVNLNQTSGKLNSLNITGGEVTIKDRGDLQVHQIHVTSEQDTSSSKDQSKGMSVGAGFGGSSGNISLGYNQSKGKSDSAWVNNQSKLLIGDATHDANLDAMGVKQITNTGGVIANASQNVDGTLTDHGNMTYSGDLTLKDIQDHRTSDSRSFGINTSIGVPVKGSGSSSNTAPGGSTTLSLQHGGQNTEQLTKATMGLGTVAQATTATNRDVTNSQTITKDQTTGLLKGSVAVDHRLLTADGRAQIIDEQKQLPEDAKQIIEGIKVAGEIGKNIVTSAAQTQQIQAEYSKLNTEDQQAAYQIIKGLADKSKYQQNIIPALIAGGEVVLDVGEGALSVCSRSPACAKFIVNAVGGLVASKLGIAILNEGDTDKKATPKPMPSTSGASATGMPPDDEDENTTPIARDKLLDKLASKMEKPIVEDKKLQNIANDLYRQNAKIGNGSTGAAVRYEAQTGEAVGNRLHTQKANDYVDGLEHWLKNNPNASTNDRMAAEQMLRDLKNALNGK